jgi:hypothetical protein
MVGKAGLCIGRQGVVFVGQGGGIVLVEQGGFVFVGPLAPCELRSVVLYAILFYPLWSFFVCEGWWDLCVEPGDFASRWRRFTCSTPCSCPWRWTVMRSRRR